MSKRSIQGRGDNTKSIKNTTQNRVTKRIKTSSGTSSTILHNTTLITSPTLLSTTPSQKGAEIQRESPPQPTTLPSISLPFPAKRSNHKRVPFSRTLESMSQNNKVWNEMSTFSEYLECFSEIEPSLFGKGNMGAIRTALCDKLSTRFELKSIKVKRDGRIRNDSQVPIFLKNIHYCELPFEKQVEGRLTQILGTLEEKEKSLEPTNLTMKEYLDNWLKIKDDRDETFQLLYDSFHPNQMNFWNSMCQLSSADEFSTPNSGPEDPVSIRYTCAIDSVLFGLTCCLEFRDLIPPIRGRSSSQLEEEVEEMAPKSLLVSSFCDGMTSKQLENLPAVLKMAFNFDSSGGDNKFLEEMYQITMGFYWRYTFGPTEPNERGNPYKNGSFKQAPKKRWNEIDLTRGRKGFLMFHHLLNSQISPSKSTEVFCVGESVFSSDWGLPEPEPKATVLRNIFEGCNYWDGLLNMLRFTHSSLRTGYYSKSKSDSKAMDGIDKDLFFFDISPKVTSSVEEKAKRDKVDLAKKQVQKMVILSQLRYSFMNFYFGNLRKEQIVHWGAGHHSSTSSETLFKGALCSLSSVMPSHDPVCCADFDISFLSSFNSEIDHSLASTVQKSGQSCVRLKFPHGGDLNSRGKLISSNGEVCAEAYESLDLEASSLMYSPGSEHQEIFGLKHEKHNPLKYKSNEKVKDIDIGIPTATALFIEIMVFQSREFDWRNMSLEEALEWERTKLNEEVSKGTIRQNSPLGFLTHYSPDQDREPTVGVYCVTISKKFLETRINEYEVIKDSFCVTLTPCHAASFCVDPLVYERRVPIEGGGYRKVTKIYQPVCVIVRKKGNHFSAHGLLSKAYGQPIEETHPWCSRSKLKPTEDRIDHEESFLPVDSLMKGWHYDNMVNLGGAVPWINIDSTTSEGCLSDLDPLAECVLKKNFVTLGCDETLKPNRSGGLRNALDDPNLCYRVGKFEIEGEKPGTFEITHHLMVINPLVSIASMFYVLRGEMWEEEGPNL